MSEKKESGIELPAAGAAPPLPPEIRAELARVRAVLSKAPATDGVRPKRASISKRTRFEVFKRDQFRCQYCGGESPAVVLHVDHIHPVALGGDNDLSNLITACAGCNLGKSDKKLSDDTAVAKKRAQIEELQERREQIEMMMDWQRGLRDIDEHALDSLCAYFEERITGRCINATGRATLKKYLRSNSLQAVLKAVDTACDQYLRFAPDGKVEPESVGIAFNRIGGILHIEKKMVDDPEIRDLVYIRGILKNRCPGVRSVQIHAIQWLKAARSWGVSIEDLKDIARACSGWTNFSNRLDKAIDAAKEEAARCSQ